uniref:Uncharacterized protein n=1 Tax=Meloidogyne incognita TaxID=6306 RepID=A0A914KQ81_MELIC
MKVVDLYLCPILHLMYSLRKLVNKDVDANKRHNILLKEPRNINNTVFTSRSYQIATMTEIL